jgi:2Fe-2S ferredoxin
MPKITFLPVNITCEAAAGESILDIAINNDVPLQHACGGFCACTTCHVYVKSGGQNLSDMEEDETERLASVYEKKPESRLGCQAKLMGDVTVEMVNLE